MSINKLEGRELDTKMAELMGYVCTGNTPEGKPLIYEDGSGVAIIIDDKWTPRMPHRRFLPSTDITAAYQVEDRIEELELIEEYCYQIHRVTLASWNLRRDGITQVAIWRLIHATPAERCRAAVLAVEAE